MSFATPEMRDEMPDNRSFSNVDQVSFAGKNATLNPYATSQFASSPYATVDTLSTQAQAPNTATFSADNTNLHMSMHATDPDLNSLSTSLAQRYVENIKQFGSKQAEADTHLDAQPTIQPTMHEMHTGLTNHMGHIQNMHTGLKDHQSHLQNMHTGLRDHKSHLENMHTGLKDHQMHLKNMHTGLQSHKERLEALHTGASNQARHLENVVDGMKDHQTHLRAMRTGIIDHKNTLQTHSTDLHNLSTKAKDHHVGLSLHTHALNRHSARIKALEARLGM